MQVPRNEDLLNEINHIIPPYVVKSENIQLNFDER